MSLAAVLPPVVELPASRRVARARVKLGVKLRDPGVGHHIPHHGENHREEEEDERGPLDNGFPGPDLPVVQDKQADGEAGQGAAEVAHEARPVLRVIEPHPDGEHHVVDGEKEDERDPDDLCDGALDNLLDPEVAVLLPVEGHCGQVGGYQGVNLGRRDICKYLLGEYNQSTDPSTGPGEVGGAVTEAGPQAARQHARHVDHEHLGRGEQIR